MPETSPSTWFSVENSLTRKNYFSCPSSNWLSLFSHRHIHMLRNLGLRSLHMCFFQIITPSASSKMPAPLKFTFWPWPSGLQVLWTPTTGATLLLFPGELAFLLLWYSLEPFLHVVLFRSRLSGPHSWEAGYPHAFTDAGISITQETDGDVR